MSLRITELCSACDACLSECPTNAITAGRPYVIDPDKCVECVGFFDAPQCMDVCPVNGAIVPAVVQPGVG
ncbi:MAG: 4Fe-4S binding protein [Gammaproteobacteria bacterium]|nr:4Fe-4S binding protein [Gammaproteobacteria bacterium]